MKIKTTEVATYMYKSERQEKSWMTNVG